MTIEIGFTDELTNARYAPLAALSALYQRNHVLDPLQQVQIPMKIRDFSPADKLHQVFLSILAGCETLSEVTTKLKPERGLATIWGWERFADQSSMSRTLDALTLKQIDQLRQSPTLIWVDHSQARVHDWRGFLWLDFDLSGLPCSPLAEESQKGYFSGKKTSPDVSWRGSAPASTGKRSGQTWRQAVATPSSACNANRGGAEVEQFRNDKSGLSLEARRKHSFLGQKGYILLTDLAHNLLADFHHRALLGSRFETYGPKRMVRDLLNMPGLLVFEQGKLVRVELLTLNQNAKDLSICLERYSSDG